MRQAGYLFVAAGAIGLLGDVVPHFDGKGHLALAVLALFNVAAGVAALTQAKKHVLHGPAQFVLPLFAFANVSATIAAGVLPPATYGVWFVLIIVWVGLWHTPRAVLACAPIATGAYVFPLLIVGSPTPGSLVAVLIIVPVAVLAGMAIARSAQSVRRSEAKRRRMLRELSRAILTDELTGVGNRRLGEILLENLQPDDAILLIDVDRFKEVNDTYGHTEGDRLLRRLGSFFLDSVRTEDAVARMGGEEFMIVIRSAGQTAMASASRLVSSWSEASPLATLSIGVSVHKFATRPKATYAAADEALYAAKRTGRNRAVDADKARSELAS